MNVFYFDWEYDLLMFFQNFRSTPVDWIMKFFSFLGNKGWLPILIALLLLIFYKKDRRVGLSTTVGLLLAFIVCNLVLKNLFNRARPCDIWTEVETIVNRPHDSSFPSGHTNASFAVASAIILRNKKWGIFAIIVALLIAISRMYLFMHFPTDVLAGAANGFIWALISYFVINWIYKKTNKPVDTF